MMRYLGSFIVVLLMFANVQLAQAQFIEEEIPDKEENGTALWRQKVFFGGNLGLSFGSETSFVNVSPIVGYRVLPQASVGAGPVFEYYKQAYANYKNQSFIWGGKVFLQSIFFDALMLYGELNVVKYNSKLYYHSKVQQSEDKARAVPWLGGGYYQRSGRNSGFYILFLVNMNYDPNFIYPPYDIKVGFNF